MHLRYTHTADTGILSHDGWGKHDGSTTHMEGPKTAHATARAHAARTCCMRHEPIEPRPSRLVERPQPHLLQCTVTLPTWDPDQHKRHWTDSILHSLAS